MPFSVSVTFIQSNGTKKEVNAKVGSSLMEVGIENDVGIVGERPLVKLAFCVTHKHDNPILLFGECSR